jgi:hypothetical protein
MKLFALVLFAASCLMAQPKKFDYRVLATSKTSTLEREMNEAADSGFVFVDAMGGQSAFGGKEGIVVMIKELAAKADPKFVYRLLATNKTSTMEKEMLQLGEEGFEYKAQTIFSSSFGGQEVVVILERDRAKPAQKIRYKLLATSKTSTMQKELRTTGEEGFRAVGVTVAKTAFGGNEVVSILRAD